MQEKINLALQNPEITHALDSMSYHTMMRQAERQMLDRTLFERKIASKIAYKEDKKDAE